MDQKLMIAMGTSGTPGTAQNIPGDAKNGSFNIGDERVPTKEWHDDKGHAVHVGDVTLGDTYIGGITGRSRRSIDDARGKVKEAVEHVLERMPYTNPDVVITN